MKKVTKKLSDLIKRKDVILVKNQVEINNEIKNRPLIIYNNVK